MSASQLRVFDDAPGNAVRIDPSIFSRFVLDVPEITFLALVDFPMHPSGPQIGVVCSAPGFLLLGSGAAGLAKKDRTCFKTTEKKLEIKREHAKIGVGPEIGSDRPATKEQHCRSMGGSFNHNAQ